MNRAKTRGKSAARSIEIIGLHSLPEIRPGDDLCGLVIRAAQREEAGIAAGDVIVLTQKVVSKSEGRLISLRTVKPSELARSWAKRLGSDARLVEVVLRESVRIVRMNERVLITETCHGFVCANAGVDHSNMPGKDWVSCLPRNPDASAARFVRGIRKHLKLPVAVVISDTFGRPWRLGLSNVAIGAAGLSVLEDLRGQRDAAGHRLSATILAVADALAAAAGLAMGKTAQVPVVILRGYRYHAARDTARRIIRPAEEDLFR